MSTLVTKPASEFMKNFKSLIVLSVLGSVLMGCPQNGRQSNEVQPGTLGYRGGIQFEVPSINGAYSELAAMPYAIAKPYPDYRPGMNGRTMLEIYVYENGIASGVNPCLGDNQTLINQQPRQRSFYVRNLDPQIPNPQQVYDSRYSQGYWGSTPFVQFQLNDSTAGRSTIVSNFTGAITIAQYDQANRTVLINFDNVRSSYYGCTSTSQNQGLSCGARISGQILVGLCW